MHRHSLNDLPKYLRKLKRLAQVDNNNDNIASAICNVKKGLIELDNLLNNKSSSQELIKMVHAQIHPSLQLTYDLELKQWEKKDD